jgi:hypothetical protein
VSSGRRSWSGRGRNEVVGQSRVCLRRGAIHGDVRLSVEEERRMESGRGTGVSVWIFFEVRVGGSGRKWAQIGKGGMCARQLAVSLDVHWPVRAAHRTGETRQQDGSGMR